jgi:hypothetical protein
MTTNDEYPMWSTENQCRKWWPNDDYPKFSWLPEPKSHKMATDKNPRYVSYMSSGVDRAPANIVQETGEGLLAGCAAILGLAPGQDGASQPQPSWDVGLASFMEEEEHDNTDQGPEDVPPPPKLPKPISPESSSTPHSPIAHPPMMLDGTEVAALLSENTISGLIDDNAAAREVLDAVKAKFWDQSVAHDDSEIILVSACLSIIPFAGSAELTCYRSKILLPPPPPELAPSARAAPALELQT